MQTDIADFATKTLLRDLRERVEAAAGIAKAAHVPADAGLTRKGVEIANDVDELIHDAETLLGLVSAVARSAETATAPAPAATDEPHDAHASEGDEPGSPMDESLADATIRAFLAQADGSASAPSSATMNGTRCAMRPAMKATSRESRSSLATRTGLRSRRSPIGPRSGWPKDYLPSVS